MKSTVFVTAIFISSFVYANDCKIKGEPILWAYDYCYSLNELQNPDHATIKSCIQKAKATIKELGNCKAKQKFKALICEVGDFYDGSYFDCINSDKAIGPTVKKGSQPST